MYKLNDILLSDYSIVAGQAPNSNIPVSGIFDLPQRIGKTYQEWAEEDGVEPYVLADEIFLGGRDITFYGLIMGSQTEIQSKLNIFKSAISAFTDLVVFTTDYGNYNVIINEITLDLLSGLGSFVIKMREPQPADKVVALPFTGVNIYTIDSIPLSSFGLTVTKVIGRCSMSDMKQQNFTIWDQEGYQVTGRKAETITINGIIQATDLTTFQYYTNALYKIFMAPNLRKLMLDDYMTIEGFAIDGFNVSAVQRLSTLMIGQFSIQLIKTGNYITVYLTEDNDTFILTTEEGEVLVYG
jgi:hypothetical protein